MDSPNPTARITGIETFAVPYPVAGSFKFFTRPARDTVMVRITSESGETGWGQSVPSPSWSYETCESVRTTIDAYLAPALIGMDAFDTEAIWRVMNRVIAPSFSIGQPIAKAGIDLAIFDLTGRILGQSAAQRWQVPEGGSLTLSWTISASTLDELHESVAGARARGYHHFNVKVGANAKFDLELCRELRQLAPASFVWVDANGGYDLATALEVAPKFADLGIAALEQPLPANHLVPLRALRRQRALPILLDEPIVSLDDLRTFHELDLLDGVAMKVSRCGGLTGARRILEYLQAHGLLFFASGLTDPDLSLAASLLLFKACGLQHPAALNGAQYLSGSILRTPLVITGDQAEVPQGPGLGIEVDPDLPPPKTP
ncbi:MAG: mandelate racemase [Verrucomicrobia bacterium]|nr:mandelate racemase [Verrucomicrobiota bacterium]